MAAINIPSLNISGIEEGLGQKKTQEAILDTLQKYRKELNFLLMNLDYDNMPIVADGHFNLVDDVDQVTIRVTDAEGNITDVTQTATSITTFIGDMEGNEFLEIMTAGGLARYVSDNKSNISKVTQTATDISAFVGDMSGSYANLIMNAGGITSFVTDGNQLASRINQTNNTVTIDAHKINLNGITNVNKTLTLGSDSYDLGEVIFHNTVSIRASSDVAYGYGIIVSATDIALQGTVQTQGLIADNNSEFYDYVTFHANTDVEFRGVVDFSRADVIW